MKTISSRQLAENQEEVLKELPKESFFVITKDDEPMAILVPTSKKTLEEDVEEETFRRARQAVASIRLDAARRGLDKMTLEEINTEIAASRRDRATQQLS